MKLDLHTNYQVRDIFEASYLFASGCDFLGLEDGFGFYYFVFQDKEKCESLQFQYWSGNASICPKQYAEAYKSLKSIVFQRSKEQKHG